MPYIYDTPQTLGPKRVRKSSLINKKKILIRTQSGGSVLAGMVKVYNGAIVYIYSSITSKYLKKDSEKVREFLMLSLC